VGDLAEAIQAATNASAKRKCGFCCCRYPTCVLLQCPTAWVVCLPWGGCLGSAFASRGLLSFARNTFHPAAPSHTITDANFLFQNFPVQHRLRHVSRPLHKRAPLPGGHGRASVGRLPRGGLYCTCGREPPLGNQKPRPEKKNPIPNPTPPKPYQNGKGVHLDDCIVASSRDAGGDLVADPARFPSGFAALGEYIHARGAKFGFYTAMGASTCAGRPGSAGFEEQDGAMLARIGADYLKACVASSPLRARGPT